MQIIKLDHVNIKTHQLDNMINWYTDILGLELGDRPDSRSVGAWIYCGDTPIVHLVEVDSDNAYGSDVELKLEHFAFTAHGLSDFEKRLRSSDNAFRRSDKPEINQAQINIWDPDGNHIHVDFKLDETL